MRMQPNARIAGFEFCSEKIMVGRVIFFALDKYLGFLLCLLRGVCIPRLFRHVLSGMFFLNGLVFCPTIEELQNQILFRHRMTCSDPIFVASTGKERRRIPSRGRGVAIPSSCMNVFFQRFWLFLLAFFQGWKWRIYLDFYVTFPSNVR